MITTKTENTATEWFIPMASPVKFDVMDKDRFKCTISFPCQVGVEYTISEVKAYIRLVRPSLSRKNFDIKLSGKPKFRN